jgi:SacI restriction endonuclease
MEPSDILDAALRNALNASSSAIENSVVHQRVVQLATTQHALTRLVLSCALAKAHDDKFDARKPYTQIGDADAFSGRTYDEKYLTAFILEHELPCNPTTAFLTPALRNHNRTLAPDLNLEGKPPALYKIALELLEDMQTARVSARAVLTELLRQLLNIRDEKRQRMTSLLAELHAAVEALPLSAQQITDLLEQHLRLPHSSRLPVLMVAAAYAVAGTALQEEAAPLAGHNAADRQSGTVGDVEIVLSSERLIAAYEMKAKTVTRNDIDLALQKLRGRTLEHYVFITTEPIDSTVNDYAKGVYESSGIEVIVLDCIGFVRHFLHFFHRQRFSFLEHYQRLLLAEPESAVRTPLKEAWLALRLAAEH